MFKLKQNTPTSGDCTAGYAVEMELPYTLEKFISEILTRGEWGYIHTNSPSDAQAQKEVRNCEYKRTELLSAFGPERLSRAVKSARASGGYSRMDYEIELV